MSSPIGNYSLLCFGTKISLEIKFDDRLVRNKPFYTIKKLILQSGHIDYFSKGVPHNCRHKLEITPCFVLAQK